MQWYEVYRKWTGDADLATAKKQIKHLEGVVRDLTQVDMYLEYGKLKVQLELEQERVKELEQEVREARSTYMPGGTIIQCDNLSNAELITRLNQRVKELEARLKKECESYIRIHSKQKDRIDELGLDRKHFQKVAAKHRDHVEEEQGKNIALRERVLHLEALLKASDQRRIQLAADVYAAKRRNTELERNFDAAVGEGAKLIERVKELEDERYEPYEERLKVVQDANERQGDTIIKLRKREKELDERVKELEQLPNFVATHPIFDERNKLSERVKELKGTINSLHGHLAQVRDRVGDAEKAFKMSQERVKELETQQPGYIQLERDLKGAEGALQDMTKEQIELRNEIGRLSRTASRLQKFQDLTGPRVDRLKETITDLQCKLIKEVDDHQNLKQWADQAYVRICKFENENSVLRAYGRKW